MPQIPVSLNFSAALHLTGRSNASLSLSAPRIKETGALYTALLRDLDQLLATDPAFLLGSWLAEARKLGGNATDCTDTVLGDKLSKCDDFMEWNARAADHLASGRLAEPPDAQSRRVRARALAGAHRRLRAEAVGGAGRRLLPASR